MFGVHDILAPNLIADDIACPSTPRRCATDNDAVRVDGSNDGNDLLMIRFDVTPSHVGRFIEQLVNDVPSFTKSLSCRPKEILGIVIRNWSSTNVMVVYFGKYVH